MHTPPAPVRPRVLRRDIVRALLVALVGCGRRAFGVDLDGHPLDPLAASALATVLVFVATTCPVSNRYAPDLQRIHDTYVPRGVSMWLVYWLRDDTPAAIRDHLRAHSLTIPALRDPDRALVREASASVTPEAALFRRRSLAYHGRIDDRQVDFGVTRPAATVHDLTDAIDRVLAGRAPAETYAPARGCAIP